jgi:hypothetical protein
MTTAIPTQGCGAKRVGAHFNAVVASGEAPLAPESLSISTRS